MLNTKFYINIVSKTLPKHKSDDSIKDKIIKIMLTAKNINNYLI
jgi:hypothetical protein